MDRAADAGHRAPGHGKSQSRPLASFRRKERFEDAVEMLGRDSGAFVGDAYRGAVLLAAAIDADGATRRHRVSRVEEQIDEHVPEFRGVREDGSGAVGARDEMETWRARSRRVLEVRARERDGFRDGLAEIDGLEVVAAFSREVAHPGDPHRGVIDDTGESVEIRAAGVSSGLSHQLEPEAHHVQRVVEIVCYPRRDLPDRLQAVAVEQYVLRLPQLGFGAGPP